MIKIAIAGNIAAGKSQVELYLAKSYPVIDTDLISHKLLDVYKNQIIEEFKNFNILENNKINRKLLGNLVFSNSKLKLKLENILHPLIKTELYKFFEENKNAKYCFVSIPLIFEAHFEDLFDKIIFIYAKDNLRLERLMKRNNLSLNDALARLNSQQSQDEKIKKSDYIIKNESDIQNLYAQIDKIIKAL